MGLSSKKTASKTNQTTTANVTPTNPQFTTDAIGGIAGRAEDYFKTLDPYSLVPGADPLTARAANSAAGLGFGGAVSAGAATGPGGVPLGANGTPDKSGSLGPGGSFMTGGLTGPNKAAMRTDGAGRPMTSPMEAPTGAPADPYAAAEGTLNRVSNTGYAGAKAGDIQGGIAGFLNPYLKDVVDTSLANYDYGAGQQQAGADLAQAQDTTFGGSGGSIEQALLKDRLATGRGTLAAGLRSDAYDKAAALSGQQAGLDTSVSMGNASGREGALNRQATSALGLADVGSAQQGNERSNITLQNQIGEYLRQIKAAQAGAPIAALGANADILGKTPFDLFRGTNATGSLTGTTTGKESGASLTDWLGALQQAAKAAATAGA